MIPDNEITRVDVEGFKENMHSAKWRLSHLYKITNKEKQVVTFEPNSAQKQLFEDMHSRNVIPKARQRGLSTAIQILILDTALFSANTTHKVTAQHKDAATEIFRDKIKFDYDRLPKYIRDAKPLTKSTETEVIFSNKSSITVSTSARSGTVSILHISEFGKIAAEYPGKAKEIITGSIPAVPKNGLIFVESTSEGADGAFHDMVMRAVALKDSGRKLALLNFKIHFYSWWDADEYQLIGHDEIVITKNDREYFENLELTLGILINIERRRWYVTTRDEFGSDELMWQEYPSTIDEAFKRSLEGTYYRQQFTDMRKSGRITRVPYDPTYPVSTYWDIGGNDETAIWCIQHTRFANNVINYIESSNESFDYFVKWLKDLGYLYETHHLPHDADHKRQLGLKNMTAEEMIKELSPGWKFKIVPRIARKIIGIQQTRNIFSMCYFDEENCSIGLTRLEMYKKDWDKRLGTYKDEPKHDKASNGADAFRMFGQQVANGQVIDNKPKFTPREASDWRL